MLNLLKRLAKTEKRKNGSPDYFLLASILFLIFIGLIVLASASSPVSTKFTGKPNYYFFRQLFIGVIPGIIIAIIFYNISAESLRKKSFWVYIVSIFMMCLVFVPNIGLWAGGGKRWIKLFGFSFQPIELLKIGLILYLSAWLTKNTAGKNKFVSLFVPFSIIMAIPAIIIILQPNISALGIIIFIGAVIYFVSKAPISHIVILIIIAVLIFLALMSEPYRWNRMLTFKNPESDPLGRGYHIKQSLIAIGSGGIWGKGLGFSEQKMGFLPKPVITDSIFSVFAEEAGLVGSIMLLICYGILVWRGIRVAKKTNDDFSKIVAVGIVSWIGIQSFINIGAMMNLMPLTGVPLPFLSYGGSALVCELAAMGILLNISKRNSQP